MDYTEFARKYFADDVFATKTVGIEIEKVDIDYAKCRLKVDKRHVNANNQVMGGAIFTLADFSFAIASNVKEQNAVSISSNIQYIGTLKGEYLISECKSIKSGRTMCFFETTITDDLGTKIAVITTTGYRTGTPMKVPEKKN